MAVAERVALVEPAVPAARSPEFWQFLLAAELPPAKSRGLIEGFGSSALSPSAYFRQPGLLGEKELQRIEAVRPDSLSKALAVGVQVVEERQYPCPLNQTINPPPALFLQGDFGVLEAPTIAIVGTRGASPYGKACAIKFAEAFARAGVTVVSGGALGIDGAAHKAALEAQGKTVAVLAGGIDMVYPAMHAGLFRQIRANGCLLSQFAVGSRPNPYKFLTRNGLIAAASRAVVVIECPERSGALNTANTANEMGRPVFVVPANITSETFRGSHALIRDGATLLDHPDQVLEVLGLESGPKKGLPKATGLAAKILAQLTTTPLAPEFIAERTGEEMATILAELTMLEIEGRVEKEAGGFCCRI